MSREPLPKLARFGQSGLERKLLSYMAWRPKYRFEWRISDSLNFDPTLMPQLIGDFEFLPLFEIGMRVFMFENKIDRKKAVDFYYSVQKTSRPKKTRRTRRVRKPRARK